VNISLSKRLEALLNPNLVISNMRREKENQHQLLSICYMKKLATRNCKSYLSMYNMLLMVYIEIECGNYS
jgi:hypothetical protein